MINHIIFDVDGTLTASRERIDPDFAVWLKRVQVYNKTYIVTGSDKDKITQQLGHDIVSSFEACYFCLGNEVWRDHKLEYVANWKLPTDVEQYLQEKLVTSSYPLRSGNHIEHRTGMCNFSVVGRNASPSDRCAYYEWDNTNNERKLIVDDLNMTFPSITASIGGMISIDIMKPGADKSQIVKDFPEEDTIYFLGDKMQEGGNDCSLAEKVLEREDFCFEVRDFHDTAQHLEYFKRLGIIITFRKIKP